MPLKVRILTKCHTETRRVRRDIKALAVTEAPSVHRATEVVCTLFGSFEIWSDKLKVLYNRHTESRRGRRLCNVTEVPMAQRATEV